MPIDSGKEVQHVERESILIRPYSIGQIEHGLFSARRGQCLAAPLNISRIRRNQTDKNLQQRSLASTVGPNDAEHFTRAGGECNSANSILFTVTLGEIGGPKSFGRFEVYRI